jgi:hypothetical protein
MINAELDYNLSSVLLDEEDKVIAIINTVNGDCTKQVETAICEHYAADEAKVCGEHTLRMWDYLDFEATVKTEGDHVRYEFKMVTAHSY